MKMRGLFCALTSTVFFGLITSISAYAGVTDGDVTAYRWSTGKDAVNFTDDPSDDPDSPVAPLGATKMSGTSCDSQTAGHALVLGLHCSGHEGDPVSTYTCVVGSASNATDTTWCLYSENPRTGDKAWAVKYVDGEVPTNDGRSIVRCQGTDMFDSVNGCQVRTPTKISIEGGYIKLDTRDDGRRPPYDDCTLDAHDGRMVFDTVIDRLYICTANGWSSIDLVIAP